MRLRRNPAGSSRATLAPSSPKPTDEANGCKLRHVAPKTLQKGAIGGVLRKRSAPTGSVLWLAPISSPRKRASHGRWTNLRSDHSDGTQGSPAGPHARPAESSGGRRNGHAGRGGLQHQRNLTT